MGCTCGWWQRIVLVYGGVDFINYFILFFFKFCRSVIYSSLMCCDIKIKHLINEK